MRQPTPTRAVDSRGWLVGRYKVGDHVRVLGSERCGTVCSVLRYPRVTAYGVMHDDHGPAIDRNTSASYSEIELAPA